MTQARCHWLVSVPYTADSAGGRREIHVQPFPSGDGRWPVSVNGGDWPRWSKDGRVRARRD